MKAVNLLPAGERAGASAAGRSGGAAYLLTGTLAVLVLMALSYTLAGRSVGHKRDQLAQVQRQAAATEQQASALQGYGSFSTLRASRVATVQSIAESRFDWAHAFRELARTLPSDVSLTALTGTVTPGVPVDGGASVSLRSAIQAPAIELTGCTRNQDSVAQMLSDLRRVDGVRRVTLQSADKNGGGSAGGGQSCGKDAPQFAAVIFFDPKPQPSAASAAPAAATTTPTATTGSAK
jgi:Tfp pilus assembly protein PilN